MLKHILIAGTLLASALPALAQVGDPTFNGLVATANCYIRNVTVCRAASCEQVARNCQGDRCGQLSLLLKTREYMFVTGKKPLQITEIAQAEVGKTLWVKFQVQMKAGLGEGRLTLQPDRLGGHTTSAVVDVAAADDSSGRSFSLINDDCEQVPDER